MKDYRVHDKTVSVFLNKKEAEAIRSFIKNEYNVVKRSTVLLKALTKIEIAQEDAGYIK